MFRAIRIAAALAALALPACARHSAAAPCATVRTAPAIVPYPQKLQRRPCAYVWPAASPAVDARIVSDSTLRREGAYALDVTARGITIRAGTNAGLFYARETLAQSTVVQDGHRNTPAMHVDDWPRYAWRGIHLDVARHFFDAQTVERFVDLASRYKLNVVHLHLTDNEAWRLPSPHYPRLPSREHYSEAQIRDIVAYAAARFVQLVPEIDMPAHSAAAIRAYPQLACGSRVNLCPSTASTFASAILAETRALFPGRYVHLGGDELFGWSQTQRRAFFSRESQSADRTPIVWDEESDVAPASALVMVWHLGNAAADAARRGHGVIMAPDGPLYFNAAQGDKKQEPPASRYMSTLEEVYAYDPDTPRVAGVEATLWTELIATPQQLWYMLLPRELALAEVAWTNPQQKNWPRFRAAFPAHLTQLAGDGYTFRVPNVSIDIAGNEARYGSVPGEPNAAIVTTTFPARIVLKGATDDAGLSYRMNGSQWHTFAGPLDLTQPTKVEAREAIAGRFGAITTLYVGARNASMRHSRTFEAVVSP